MAKYLFSKHPAVISRNLTCTSRDLLTGLFFQDFQKSPGRDGYWFCIRCKPSPHTGVHTYNATSALKHEQSQVHKHSLKTTGWCNDPVETWATSDGGSDMAPYEMLRSDTERNEVPMGKRVKSWMKDMARAERGEDIEEEEEDDDEDLPIVDTWDDWRSARNDWGSGGDDDWMSRKPWDECMPLKKGGYPPERPPLPGEVDLQAAADFKFVEKVAKARGLTKESRRLHYFFRVSSSPDVLFAVTLTFFFSVTYRGKDKPHSRNCSVHLMPLNPIELTELDKGWVNS